MPRYFLILLASFITGSSFPQQLVITHTTIIDVTSGRLLKDRSVIIRGNRIADIDSLSIPSGKARYVDGRGKYLIPGLWDMHAHLSFDGAEALEMLVTNGVTGVRDMGGNLQQLDRWQREINAGVRRGPRIRRAGPFIDGPKKMSPLRRTFTLIVTDEAGARRVVDSLQAAGVDYLKVHSRLSRRAFFALADEARKKNIPFVTHVPQTVTVVEASDAGARSIEHTESLLGDIIYEERDSIREKRTTEALARLYGQQGKEIFAHIAGNKSFYDPTLISLYQVRGTSYENSLGPRLLPLIKGLYDARVLLLTGSDFAYKEAGIRPGYDLHGELALFVKAGIPPLEALQAATLHPAQCLYMDDSLGTVEKGKIADLVLLNANPLRDIRNTRDIYAVIANGVLIQGRRRR